MKLAIATAAAAAAVLWCTQVHAAEPVKQVNIYVEPFYRSPRSAGEPPRVAVGARYDALLASSRREDILAARDIVTADPKTVTPMTMMVLAVRLYDVGERDEAVFWFYAAKDRMLVLTEVATPAAIPLGQAVEAIRAFSTLAGPVINGYAFCDLKNQQAIRARALDWVEANPYQAMYLEQIPARSQNRAALAAQAVRRARDNAAAEARHLQDPPTRDEFLATRKRNEVDAKFCWK